MKTVPPFKAAGGAIDAVIAKLRTAPSPRAQKPARAEKPAPSIEQRYRNAEGAR